MVSENCIVNAVDEEGFQLIFECIECGYPHVYSDLMPHLVSHAVDVEKNTVTLTANFYCKECGCPSLKIVSVPEQKELAKRACEVLLPQ